MFLANFHFGKTRNLKQIILPSGHTGFDLDRCFVHRLLREIDRSSAMIGGPAAAWACNGTESRGKSIHWPQHSAPNLVLCSQWHNYWCQQRQAGRANEQSTYLGVYGFVTQKCFFIFASSNAV